MATLPTTIDARTRKSGRDTRRRFRGARRGLAPLELVLWIPVLLMTAALMVIFGTSAAWRIRGEVASRDAVWRVLTPRTGNNEHRPDTETWPHNDATYEFQYSASQLSSIDLPQLQHEVVRGPLPNGWEVTPILDPNEKNLLEGRSSIRRDFPMLSRMGDYRSGTISHEILDGTWAVGWSYRRGVLEWPNEVGGFRPWGTVPNEFRRSVLLYKFPKVSEGKSAFAGAVTQAVSLSQSAGMRVLDRDEEIRHYTGGYRDFYPRARVICTLDSEEMREQALERFVIDYLDNRNEVQLGGITRLPRTLTQYFIGMYERRIREIDRLIELQGDPGGELGREKSLLEGKLDQLEPYEDRLDEIEADLRSTSTAR
jgi:hypothetical protein